jgi:antitoxin component of RelBE/YafQ-DinJ toxin-antitoxin module
MSQRSINISTDNELFLKAEEMLTDIGMDMNTAFNILLQKFVNREIEPLEAKNYEQKPQKRPISEAMGMFKGQIWVADDFDEPLEAKNHEQKPSKRPRSEAMGMFKGQIWEADDFDEPLEDMKEYME